MKAMIKKKKKNKKARETVERPSKKLKKVGAAPEPEEVEELESDDPLASAEDFDSNDEMDEVYSEEEDTFMQGDVDKDGYLGHRRFIAILLHLIKMKNKKHPKKAFEFFDKNQNGYIEIEELREALNDEIETNKEVINAILEDVDTDKDELISY